MNRCITEGRRAFLSRFARIEAGEECERWSPVLSALADGEATAEQLMEARPHLRNCPGCRSSLAEMRHSAAAVAALLPPATLPLGGGDPVAGRIAELVASLHDRAANAVVRAQAAAEVALSGKLAAVAATTAALAGGGVAAEHRLGGDPARAQVPAAPAAVHAAAPTAPDPTPPQPSGAARAVGSAPEGPVSPAPAAPEGPAEGVPEGAAFAPEAEAARSGAAGPSGAGGAGHDPFAPTSARSSAPSGPSARSGADGASGRPSGGGAEFGLLPPP